MPKSITRMDYKKNIGWYVRVKFKGKEHRKYFGDSVWGGTEEALEAAIQWRNEKERELGKPRTDRMVISKTESDLGVVGVRRTVSWTGAADKDGTPLPNYTPEYVVTWSPKPNVRKQSSFSVEKYGEEEARKMAIEIRKHKEMEIYGGTIDL
jgi:hypothetical protein